MWGRSHYTILLPRRGFSVEASFVRCASVSHDVSWFVCDVRRHQKWDTFWTPKQFLSSSFAKKRFQKRTKSGHLPKWDKLTENDPDCNAHHWRLNYTNVLLGLGLGTLEISFGATLLRGCNLVGISNHFQILPFLLFHETGDLTAEDSFGSSFGSGSLNFGIKACSNASESIG